MSRPRKTADQWFAEYGDSHQDDTNELIHWICVPVIFLCVVGFIRSVPVPAAWPGWFSWDLPAALGVLVFYLRLSPPLAGGMLLFMGLCHGLLQWQAAVCPVPVWKTSLILFVAAWIGQFIGHKIEGKKPSFLKDLVFLLIGPAWLLHFIYRKLGLRY
jgi:uncharacterized membrane protein YGL010W